MLVRANTVNEINDMVDLSMEQGYDLVIQGGVEAWVLADKLGAAGVGVIYTPRTRRRARKGREDDTGSFVESPRIFQEKGIPFSLATLSNSISMGGLAGRDLTSLPLEAAFAVRGGADERTALQSNDDHTSPNAGPRRSHRIFGRRQGRGYPDPQWITTGLPHLRRTSHRRRQSRL